MLFILRRLNFGVVRSVIVFVLISVLTEACFKHKLVSSELEIYQRAEQKNKAESERTFCNYIASVVDHKRYHTGRMTASAPPTIFYYAARCKNDGLLQSNTSGLASDSEERLLLRAALCGYEPALQLYRENFQPDVEPLFKLSEKSDGLYIKKVHFFSAPSDARFPYSSVRGDNFCGYAKTEFTATGIILTPIVLIPTLVIGAPFALIGGVVYVLVSTINFFR